MITSVVTGGLAHHLAVRSQNEGDRIKVWLQFYAYRMQDETGIRDTAAYLRAMALELERS